MFEKEPSKKKGKIHCRSIEITHYDLYHSYDFVTL